MKTSRQDIELLCGRIDKLERQSRFQRRIILIGLLAIGCAIVMAQTKPRTVEAERFVLRDAQGHARITIGTPSSSGATVDTAPDEPVIWFSDKRGNDRVMISTEGLRLSNERFRPAANLTFTKTDGAQISLYNNEGKLLFRAP